MHRIAPQLSAALLACAVLSVAARGQQPGGAISPLVEQGSEPAARAYYHTISSELGLQPHDPNDPKNGAVFNEQHTMLHLLDYLGYRALLPADLERLGPADLMHVDRLAAAVSNPQEFAQHFGQPPAPDDPVRRIAAFRYFAPKITNVASPTAQLGWRKVVRLLPRGGSTAEERKIGALWLLFNHFAPAGQDPFQMPSVNNQAMLVKSVAVAQQRSVYWLVYNGAQAPQAPAGLTHFLTASFDAAEPANPPPDPNDPAVRRYHVPEACAQCHGDQKRDPALIFSTAKLNLLDTDHWFDRIGPGDDFARQTQGGYGVLYDGGTDLESPKFRAAFDVARLLNREIKQQNQAVEPFVPAVNQPSFQLRAVTRWLELHDTGMPGDYAHRDLFARAIAPRSPNQSPWSKESEIDRRLLPLMNRFCYRCHSSFEYHVFDRPRVKSLSADMVELLDRPTLQDKRMPQDRDLSTNEEWRMRKQELQQLLTELDAEP